MTLYTIILFTGLAAVIWTFLEYSIKKTKNVPASFVKNWIGTFFIFSAAVKLVDPVGFSIKLGDYFAVFKTSFLNPFAQFLSFVILVLEFILGVALLFNAWKKIVYPVLLALIVFFTLLTGISAIFGVVQDCGCFGDFLTITPWESFIKDIVLTIMTLFVIKNKSKLLPFFNSKGSAIVVGLAIVASLAYTLHNFYHLPIFNFRPYKIGASIPEGMKEIEPPVYENTFTYKNKATGEEKSFVNTFPEGDGWEFVSNEEKLISKGIEAPIHDFNLSANTGEDLTEQILSFEKPIVLIVMHDVTKAKEKGVDKIKALIEYSNAENSYNYAFLSASSDANIEAYKQKLGVTGTNIIADATMIKTMIRSNPGIVLLEKGIIKGKWHYGDIPEPSMLLP